MFNLRHSSGRRGWQHTFVSCSWQRPTVWRSTPSAVSMQVTAAYSSS